ncbi:hypothetical protein [Jeotgalibacillus marinus]|uniref:DUF4175 domain-containing protein n=1 Tax=Jeotgalibacillus marinus TaxID=86667 RepID=A0ABV3Q2M4_9BACL
MRKWFGIIWLIAIFAAFILHLFALLEIFPLILSSLILFTLLFSFVIWITMGKRYRGPSSFSKRKY